MSDSEGRHGGASGHGGASPSSPDVDEARRALLKTIGVGGLGVGLAAVVAAPGGALVLYPLGHETVSGGKEYLVAGKLSQFDEGKPVKVDLFADKTDAWNRVVQVKVGSAWVIKQGDKLTAFSTVCPHLGCAVDYDGEEKKFKCPCHRSAFSQDGGVIEGPSPRPMDALETKEHEGTLSILYCRFKQGVSGKEPV